MRWRFAGRAVSCVLSVLSAALVAAPSGAEDCVAIDWMGVPLGGAGAPIEVALEAAYPGSDLDTVAGRFTTADGRVVPWQGTREVSPAARLNGATIGDMFFHPYPLAFDLAPRNVPWADPGRVRNEALMRALWFDDEAAARAALTEVRYNGATVETGFAVTSKHCVHVQLAAAFAEIAALGPAMDPFFTEVGGTFNWRVIAGTDRLSAHSYGIAVDLSTARGGYWRWSGAAPGAVGDLVSDYPAALVAAMERYGFIWGGKWHHYDSFHFEYRPELILHARLTAR